MVIKYFGKDEYAPLEEILYQNKENNGVSSLDTSMSSLLDILDDYIVHKKYCMNMSAETHLQYNKSEKDFTLQVIKTRGLPFGELGTVLMMNWRLHI